MHILNEHKTAILVFALSPAEELKRKKISNAEFLFSALSEHTLKTVQKTGLPYFHLTEKEQKGISFGERFANAIQFVFNKGYDQVITIGNDTPHLTASQINKTASVLSEEKVILGPSTDGGFYLMGMHKNNFNQYSFERLPWKTAALNSQFIKEFIKRPVQLVQLDRLHDIDNTNNLKSIISNTKNLTLKVIRILLAILRKNSKFNKVDLPLTSSNYFDHHHSRGSPQLLY